MIWVGQALPLGYVALWLKKRYNVPYAVFTHGMDILLPQVSWWKNGWLKRVLNQAAVVVANSEFTKNKLLKLGVPDEKIVIIDGNRSPEKVFEFPLVLHSSQSPSL